MDPNFKAISEISSLDGQLEATDLLIMSRPPSGTQAGYITRNVTIGKLSGILINDVSAAALSAVWDILKTRYGNLISNDLSDLEQVPDARAKLTSYALVNDSDPLSVKVQPNHAVSAIAWDKNNAITSVSALDVDALARAVAHGILKSLNLDEPLGITGTTEGVKLAELTGSASIGSIYSGDTSKLVGIQAKTSIGDDIAEVSYGGSTKRVVLKNGLDKSACATIGEKISKIGSVDLKNGIQIQPAATTGGILATIQNGSKTHEIRDGFSVQQRTTSGDGIASITSPTGTTQIYNGVVMRDRQIRGKKIFNYNGADYYNNVDVSDNTNQKGTSIAVVNGTTIYNGLVFEDDPTTNLTHVVFPNGSKHTLRGGLKVGTVTPTATVGEEIAEVMVAGSDVPVVLKNGVDEDKLIARITEAFDEKLDALKADLKAYADGLHEDSKASFLSKIYTGSQTVNGPVVFKSHINGSIDRANSANNATYATEAYSATKAKWA